MRRVLFIAFLALLIFYAADYVSVRYKIPGSRQTLGSVNLERYYAVRKKDGKMEYMFDQPQTQTCVNSIFPHLGYSPCWYAKRHSVKRVNV